MDKYRETPLRTLARSYYWQAIYHRCKDLHGQVELFENKKDFSSIQLSFLMYVEQIVGLYYDMSMGEKLLCEEVISDELRANAYAVYKAKNRDKQIVNVPNNPSGDRLMGIPRKKVEK